VPDGSPRCLSKPSAPFTVHVPGWVTTLTHGVELPPERQVDVLATGTAAGCADVADLPEFPRRLCEGLPAR